MSKDLQTLKSAFSRRDFVRCGALVAVAFAASSNRFAPAQERPSSEQASPIRLGLASYTFRNFNRAQLIGFMKQLNVLAVHAEGGIYFAKDEEGDIRSKFEYCKRAVIILIVAGDPSLETLPRLEKFIKEYNIRIAIHNHGPEDKLWHSPLDVLKAVKGM